MRYAVIDMGTNTFHLLVAESTTGKGFRALHREQATIKIGQGGISQGLITDEAVERILQTLRHFRQQIDTFYVLNNQSVAIATSAIRSAINGKQVADEIYRQTRIPVRIISGEEEAMYIYEGVKAALPVGEKISLIMDIGGGSVEFILGNQERIFWKRSFEIGAQRLLDKFMTADPISPASLQRLSGYLDEQLIPLTNAIHQYAPQTLIGASGTFETLCEMHYQTSFNPDEQPELALSVEDFENIYRQLVSKNQAERLAMPRMPASRVDMLVVACALLHFVLKKYQLSTIRVSMYALKEGVKPQPSSKGRE